MNSLVDVVSMIPVHVSSNRKTTGAYWANDHVTTGRVRNYNATWTSTTRAQTCLNCIPRKYPVTGEP